MIRQRKPIARSTRPIARRASLRSSGPVRRKKLTPRRSERVRDADYLHRVHSLPCCARDLSPCEGVIEADHAGRRPMGRKADDRTAISLCTGHHRARTDFSGPFREWDRDRMRAWLDWQIHITQLQLDGVLAAPESAVPW